MAILQDARTYDPYACPRHDMLAVLYPVFDAFRDIIRLWSQCIRAWRSQGWYHDLNTNWLPAVLELSPVRPDSLFLHYLCVLLSGSNIERRANKAEQIEPRLECQWRWRLRRAPIKRSSSQRLLVRLGCADISKRFKRKPNCSNQVAIEKILNLGIFNWQNDD